MDQPILIHGLADALAAVGAAGTLGEPVTLLSAPAAGGHGGAGWFAAIVEAARAAHPAVAVTAVLDCADRPGLALAAVRAGVRDIRFTGAAETRDRLAAIAAASGARVHGANAFGPTRPAPRGDERRQPP